MDGPRFVACRSEWAKTPWAGAPLLEHVEAAQTGRSAAAIAAASDDDDEEDAEEGEKEGREVEGGGPATPVVAFLQDFVPRWEQAQPLSLLGLDSLDLITMRNSFNKARRTPDAPTGPHQAMGGTHERNRPM